MADIETKSSELVDIHGTTINSGDTVKYLNETYVVMDVEKDACGWIIYPCGGNLRTESLSLVDVCKEIEIV